MLDLTELVKRAVKYLVEGLMVAIAAYAIPKKSLNLDEVSLINIIIPFLFLAILFIARDNSEPFLLLD